MKKIENKIMLITYADSMSTNLAGLEEILTRYFPGLFGGLHVLPFFPSSGDRGFAVVNYDKVDPTFGTWTDLDRLGGQYYLMVDFMLNHASVRCQEFQDYMARGEASPYRELFIHWDEFWPDGEPTAEELAVLYRRKEQGPYFEFTRQDGVKVKLWNTFFAEQVDLNPYTAATRDYYARNLGRLAEHAPLIRFDAFAYASKRPGTNCFFVEPEIWQVLKIGTAPLKDTAAEILPEIHENYQIQLKMAERGYWVYDFALPMLLLHGLKTGRTDRLIHWLTICPRKQFTTLDTHDGIGVVDVAGLLTDDEIALVQADIERINRPAAAYMKFPSFIKKDDGRKQTYQLMCTYYSALDGDDRAYLLARAVQFYTPGIPQVYYVGLLAGQNDIEALKRGEEPRSINRHTYTAEEIAAAVQTPLLLRLFELMRFRNDYPAFNGDFTVDGHLDAGLLSIVWQLGDYRTELRADFGTKDYRITYYDADGGAEREL